MSLDLHSVLVGSYVSMLVNAQVWLKRAQIHADNKVFDSANYLSMRLAPDMLPFSKQVLIASEIAKLSVSRLAGSDAPKWVHADTTIQDLEERLQQTVDYLSSFTPAQIDGDSVQCIVVPQAGKESLTFSQSDFVQKWSQPNFFFHMTMIYALLRHAGVDLGKVDYLGLNESI